MFYWQDVKYSLRLLAKTPVFTLLTIVVLAGGLGVSIFTFSFLYTAMVKPLPVPGGERIVRVMRADGGGLIDAADFAALRRSIRTLTDVGAYTDREVVVGTAEASRSIQATVTEWNVFAVTRTRPFLGRGLQPADQEAGAEPVVVLSYPIWHAVFGSDTSLVGSHVTLNGVVTRLVGVMPEGYSFPVAADAWVPIRPDLLTARVPEQYYVQVYARLAADADAESARAELSGLLQRVRQARPATTPERALPTGMTVQSFPMAQIGEGGLLALAVLNTLAGLILLLACINVTNLLMARANERARETALRLALGAPRGRLIVQSLWETIILCLAGGLLATVIATWGLSAINTWAHARLEGNLVFWWVWGFDRIVLLSSGAFVTLTIAVLGSIVSMRATNLELNAVLQEGGLRGGGRKEGKVARALVVTQVATVSVLMFFGSMSAIVAYRVANVDLGYDTRNLLSASVELPAERYAGAESRGLFYQQAQERLSANPAVDGVLLRTGLAEMSSAAGQFVLLDRPTTAVDPRTFVLGVLGPLTPLGIRLHEGRFFDTRDTEASDATVIVSASFAARNWLGSSPLGQQLRLTGLGESEPARSVVGVVGDVLLGNPLSRDRSPIAVYIPLRQSSADGANVLFRHRGSLVGAQAAFHQTVTALDPLIIPSNVQSFEEVLAKTSLIARSVAALFAACFAFALLLAVSGTYGLMARAIGRRTREIGIRRALGATDRMILSLLVGQGGRQLGVGAVVALPLTLLIAWGFSSFFPIALVVSLGTALLVSVAITIVVLAATWIPTRRAVALAPRDALWRD
ncbi:MAG: ABC transporter permease [Gemmatimonadota bacterium]